MTSRSLLILTTCAAAAIACERKNATPEPTPGEPQAAKPAEPSNVPEPVARGPGEPSGVLDERTVANQKGIDAIVSARCSHQMKCGNIGQNQAYATEKDCSAKLSAEKYDDLSAEECPGGIVKKELDECVAEIKNQECGNVVDTVGRLAACRESDLCKAIAR
jgi:hypothetical protein